MKFLDSEDADIGTGGYQKAFTAASALVDAGELACGLYWILSTTDCWLKRGAVDVIASKAIATEVFLKANVYWPLRVTAQDLAANGGARGYLAVIRDSADGTVYLMRTNRTRA